MKDTMFGVQIIRQRYVNSMGAALYTGKTPDQLDYAVRKGFLRVRVAKDGSKSFSVDDLEEFMNGDAQEAV